VKWSCALCALTPFALIEQGSWLWKPAVPSALSIHEYRIKRLEGHFSNTLIRLLSEIPIISRLERFVHYLLVR
jgi:hypothetical protein